MKYLIVEREGYEHALLFSDLIQHREVARGLVDSKLLSASFCSICAAASSATGLYLQIRAWGGSDSLNLSSRPDDAAAILFTLSLPTLAPQVFECATPLALSAKEVA